MTLSKISFNYFLLLFSLIPVTFLLGSAALSSNIILLDLSFLILIIYKKDYFFLKSKPIKYLLILYIYLIFNSFISMDPSYGYSRNIGFIRFIILFAAFNYFFLEETFYKKVFSFWLIVILIVSIDVFIEQFTGTNIFGFSMGEERINKDGKIIFGRIVSFFKDEPIVGGYLLGFFFILVGFLFNELKNKKQLFGFGLMVLILFTIILTGERSNSLKAFLGFGIFILLFNKIELKMKIISLLSVIILIFVMVMNITYLKIRFVSNIKSIAIASNHKIYSKIYNSAFQVFENHKIFGVGNKNYRVETCRKSNYLNEPNKEKYYCQNHPHQIYLELLSEHGILGSFLIIFVLFKLVFSKIIVTYKKDNFLTLGSLIYILIMFMPLLPTGAFFGNFLLTVFMINLSIFYASNKDYNIFIKK